MAAAHRVYGGNTTVGQYRGSKHLVVDSVSSNKVKITKVNKFTS